MTALEAVSKEIAPSAPVFLPIPECEAVWPELSAWRALDEAAQQLRARADRIAPARGQINYFMLEHDPAGPTKGQGL